MGGDAVYLLRIFVPHNLLSPSTTESARCVSLGGWFSQHSDKTAIDDDTTTTHTLVIYQTQDQVQDNGDDVLQDLLVDDSVWQPVGRGLHTSCWLRHGRTRVPPSNIAASTMCFVIGDAQNSQVVLQPRSSQGLPVYRAVHVVSYNLHAGNLVLEVWQCIENRADHCFSLIFVVYITTSCVYTNADAWGTCL